MKLKRSSKGKAVKNQFILSVGDEGAIFAHFAEGKLANKLYIDSPFSPDIKLIERLTEAYPKSPIYMLVDVIEQNYTQQVLPPVSSFNVNQQIKRRIKRDFQPNDLNNVLPLGRSKEGRKDWNFLFISLANSDPFAKWLDVVLSQKNDFGGVYLLPVEMARLLSDINKASVKSDATTDWELIVLHNKTGGFRIVAFKNGRIIFTRLAQNLVGENIAEITVGNMEQEISNTVEYLKRLAFRGEAESKITIIASSEVLQKVTPKSLKFGTVELLTPYQLSQKLDLPEAVSEKDKFSDILTATHFAVTKKHVLKFNSAFTKKIETLYTAKKAIYGLTVLLALTFVGYSLYKVYETSLKGDALNTAKVRLNQAEGRLKDITSKKDRLPKDSAKRVDVMKMSETFLKDDFRTLRLLGSLNPFFDQTFTLRKYSLTDIQAAKAFKFTATIDMDIHVAAQDQDLLTATSTAFLTRLTTAFPKYKIEYTTAPVIANQSQYEDIKGAANAVTETYVVPATITITGEENEI